MKQMTEYPSAMKWVVSRQIPQHGPLQKTTVVFGRARVVVSRKKEQDPEFMLKHRRIMGIEETQKLSKKPDLFLPCCVYGKTKEVYIKYLRENNTIS